LIGLVWRLRVDLEPLAIELQRETRERSDLVRAKEKLGTLRFHMSHNAGAIKT